MWTNKRWSALGWPVLVLLGFLAAEPSAAQPRHILVPGVPPPVLNENGVVLATLSPSVNTVSPGSIVTVFGTELAHGGTMFPELDEAGKVSTNQIFTCLEMGVERVPIFAVTRTQYNFQVPVDAPLGPISLVAVRECGLWLEARSEAVTVTVESATPGFFLLSAVPFSPKTDVDFIAARFNSIGAIVAPYLLINDQYGSSRPAKPGDVIDLYGTGWGKTTADLETGELATEAAELLPESNPSVSFGGIIMAPEDVIYVGVAPRRPVSFSW